MSEPSDAEKVAVWQELLRSASQPLQCSHFLPILVAGMRDDEPFRLLVAVMGACLTALAEHAARDPGEAP